MPRKPDLSDAFDLPPPKPRTPVPEEKAAGFVTPTPADARPAARKPKRGSGKLRRETFDGERINAYFPRDLVERLRERAFRERRSVSDALTEALSQWLARGPKVQG